MTRIIIKQLLWDKYNLEHIQKHQISKNEVIEAGLRIIYHKKTYGGRYLIVSRVGSRLIALVLKRKGLGRYYLITARDAGKNERRIVYEKEKK